MQAIENLRINDKFQLGHEKLKCAQKQILLLRRQLQLRDEFLNKQFDFKVI